MTRPIPELALAAVVDRETGVTEAVEAQLRARGPDWRAVRVSLFAKRHHLDEYGTIDALPLAEFDARLVELGEADRIRQQVRATLAGEAEAISRALEEQGFDMPATDVSSLPVEIDLRTELERELPSRQPPVAQVTPPPTTIRDEGQGQRDGE